MCVIVCVDVMQNGDVFVYTGMLEAVADIHQLTFVLGHEMAHALLGHAVSITWAFTGCHFCLTMNMEFIP